MELTYHRKGDYLFPNLIIKEETVAIGKYGMLRKTFLKEHRKNWYQSLMLTGKLENHLAQTEKAAQERMEVPDERAAGTLSGSGEGERSDGMDSPYEQPDSDGGGEHLDGIGIQLSEETTEQDLSEAEEIEASAFSFARTSDCKGTDTGD